MRVFFIDTDSELPFNYANDLGLKLIKMPYILDGVECFDDAGENSDQKAFFNTLREGKTSKTAALNMQDYIDIFEPHFKNGDEMFYLTFSRTMSGTFNYMDTAIKELREKYPNASFRDFDSRNISLGTGIQCYYAGKMFKEGKSFDEIIAFLEDFSKHVGVYFAVDDLNHLKRGGRVSGVTAVIGSVLGIKPILTVTEEAKLEKFTTVKGSKKVISFFMERMKEEAGDLDKYDVFIMQADVEEKGEALKKAVLEAFPNANVHVLMVGPVVGSHCGPGTLGIIYHRK
ncbi:MAG: DegV family protein [Clostridiales bacterium]|nr:DegV family protein [Clostridiales bacterium]